MSNVLNDMASLAFSQIEDSIAYLKAQMLNGRNVVTSADDVGKLCFMAQVLEVKVSMLRKEDTDKHLAELKLVKPEGGNNVNA